jgi:hypothetical protein
VHFVDNGLGRLILKLNRHLAVLPIFIEPNPGNVVLGDLEGIGLGDPFLLSDLVCEARGRFGRFGGRWRFSDGGGSFG